MATYKFIGNNRYFNGICTNDLVFDNKDSSENRIFCEESTCVSAKYSGVMPITQCRNEMLPSGYRDKIFEWGVEGSEWTTAINYSGAFPSSPNEFIGAGMLAKVKPPSDPDGNFYKQNIFNGRVNLYFNNDAFSNEFDIQDTSSAGYQALGGGAQFVIDPASTIGSNIYEPARDEFNRCSVSALKYNSPDISYYDVGVDPVLPPTHDVVFPKAYLLMSNRPTGGANRWWDPTSPWMSDPNPPAWVVPFRQNYISPAQPIPASAGAKCPYSPGNHPPIPPLSAFPEWNYDHVVVNNKGTYNTNRVAANSRGAKVYHPLADYHDSVKVIKGTTAGPEWHTGYRMQRYKQTFSGAKLGAAGNTSNINFGFRDIETRIKAHGYYAKWTIKSISPTYFIIHNSVYSTGPEGPGVYHDWGVEAVVTVTVTYHKFNSTIHPAYNYEYGPFPSSSDICNSSDYGNWNPPFFRALEFALAGCSPIQPSLGTGGNHFVYGTLSTAQAGWFTQFSHSPTSPVTNNQNNVLSLLSLKRINDYKLPMSWNSGNYRAHITSHYSPVVDHSYISYQTQKFKEAWVKPISGRYIDTPYPSTPNNYKIWRRKV